MLIRVGVRKMDGTEAVVATGMVSEVVRLVDDYLRGCYKGISADSRDTRNILAMVKGLQKYCEDFSQCLPAGIADTVTSLANKSNGSLAGLVEEYGLAGFAASLAAAKAGYFGRSALANTARSLAEFGLERTLAALEQRPGGMEIYNAAKMLELAKSL